jgi:hypothetical protein
MFKNRAEIKLVNKMNVPKARLYLFDSYLILMCPQENYLYDISDKAKPQLLNEFSLSKDKDDYANIFLGFKNNKAYFNIGYSGVEVIDFQDVNKPTSLGRMSDLLIGGRWEFFGDKYLITNPKIPVIYDLASLTDPKTLCKFDIEMLDFVIIQKYLICATLNSDIKIYDISQPSSPRQVSSYGINVVKLVAKDSKLVFAEGRDDIVYVLDISDPAHITIITKIEIPGPIATNSLICKDDFLFIRFMRKMVGDATYAFDIRNIIKPQRIFSYKSTGIPLYTANDKLLVFMGIKGWDGIQPLANYTTSNYKFFSVKSDKVAHIGDIEHEGIWFSSIVATENIVYIARAEGIYVYEYTK